MFWRLMPPAMWVMGWMMWGCQGTGDTADTGSEGSDCVMFTADSDENTDSAVADGVSGVSDGGEPIPTDSLVAEDPGTFDPPFVHRVEVTMPVARFDHMNARPQEDIEEIVDLTVDGVVFLRSEMKLHGGYAKTVPKKSYRFTIPDETREEIDLFGDGKERQRRFVLSAAWNDSSYLRGKTTMDLVRSHGGMAPRMSHAELYINNTYHGFYVLIERIDKLFLERQGLGKEAHMYKAENHQANWKWKPDVVAGYDIEMGPVADVADLYQLLDVLTHTPLEAGQFATQVEPRFMVDEFMVWQRVHTFADNRDTFTKNYYLYHDLEASQGTVEDRFRLISWDADATWGNNWDGAVVDPVTQKWYGTDAFSPRLLSIPSYRDSYLTEYQRALGAEFSVESIRANIQIVVARIEAAAQRDLDRWQPERSFVCEVERLLEALSLRHQVMNREVQSLLGD